MLFRFKDLQFHGKHGIIPQHAPYHIFLSTKAITLFLDTQKNPVRVESSTTEANGVLHDDLIPATVHMYLNLQAHHDPPDTHILPYLVTQVDQIPPYHFHHPFPRS